MIAKDKQTKKDKLVGFRSVNVFDVAQTDGKDIPQGPATEMILGDSEAIQNAKSGFEALADSLDISIEYRALNGPCGVFIPGKSAILICDSIEPAHQLKTLIHELAHAMLDHGKSEKPRHVLELEAESAAYIVSDSLGLDTSGYSFA